MKKAKGLIQFDADLICVKLNFLFSQPAVNEKKTKQIDIEPLNTTNMSGIEFTIVPADIAGE